MSDDKRENLTSYVSLLTIDKTQQLYIAVVTNYVYSTIFPYFTFHKS